MNTLNKLIARIALSMLGLLFTFLLVMGQGNPDPIDQAEKQQVVDSLALFMAEYYVFPEKGKEMGDHLIKQLDAGAYSDLDDPMEFGAALTQDLQSVSNDLHIGVRYAPDMIGMIRSAEEDENNQDLEEMQKREAEHSNYAFKKIEVLPGNVGYLKFNSFMHASEAGPTAVAAMNFLSHTDALIIDLRDNGGGSPSLIQLLTSYFFEYPEHLNSFYIREGEQTHQFWTLPYVPGPKLIDTELFILTSGGTFSGAEEFTYNLKQMERATVVGETTGGGAHPVSRYILNDHFMVNIPFGRAINPITETNWEGTGVEPHIQTSRAKAFDKAYLLALEKLKNKEENEHFQAALNWAYDGLKANLEPMVVEAEVLKSYAGQYGPREITYDSGSLYYQREGRQKMKMIPLTKELFQFEEIGYFRLKIIVEEGKPVAVEGLYDNGRTDKNPRTR